MDGRQQDSRCLNRDGMLASPNFKADNWGGRGNPLVKNQFQPKNKGGGRPIALASAKPRT